MMRKMKDLVCRVCGDRIDENRYGYICRSCLNKKVAEYSRTPKMRAWKRKYMRIYNYTPKAIARRKAYYYSKVSRPFPKVFSRIWKEVKKEVKFK